MIAIRFEQKLGSGTTVELCGELPFNAKMKLPVSRKSDQLLVLALLPQNCRATV